MGREHVEHLHTPEVEPTEFGALNWPNGTEAIVLSRDEGTGGLTALLRLPAGYHRVAGTLGADSQYLILSGSLWTGETARVNGFYEFVPAGSGMPVWSTTEPCEIFFKVEGDPTLDPGDAPIADGHLQIDSSRMPWMSNPVEGAAEGLVTKMLRFVEATGEMTAIVANPPRFDYPELEFHDCVEEMYLIEGDMRLANSGLMSPGSYFWRPGYITHGPFYSHTGSLMFLWTSGTLINHVPANPGSTPEENLAQAKASGSA
jgi:hypothetical protein